MKFKSLLLLLGAASLLLTGCVNATVQSKPMNLKKIEQNVVKNETTLSDLRAMLGTPFVIGTAKDDNQKVVGFVLTTSTFNNMGASIAKKVLTLGFGSTYTPMLMKDAVFKLDNSNKVTDYKFVGYSYVSRHRAGIWDEALRELTEEELYSEVSYTVDETYEKYYEHLAKEQGVSVDEVPEKDKKKTFKECRSNIYCHAFNGVEKAYGKIEVTDGNPSSEPNDGSKSILVE